MADEDATIPAEVLDEPLPDSPTFYLTAEQVATGMTINLVSSFTTLSVKDYPY